MKSAQQLFPPDGADGLLDADRKDVAERGFGSGVGRPTVYLPDLGAMRSERRKTSVAITPQCHSVSAGLSECLAGCRSGPGQMNLFIPVVMIHEWSISRPIRRFTGNGISTASGSYCRLWETGTTSATKRPGNPLIASWLKTMTQGRYFNPSSRCKSPYSLCHK